MCTLAFTSMQVYIYTAPFHRWNICAINFEHQYNQRWNFEHWNIALHWNIGKCVQSTWNIGILEHWNIRKSVLSIWYWMHYTFLLTSVNVYTCICRLPRTWSPLKSWSFACRITIPHFAFHPNVYIAHCTLHCILHIAHARMCTLHSIFSVIRL